jgi:HSP20 family protein
MLLYSNLPAMRAPRLSREMDRLFDDVFLRSGTAAGERTAWVPRVDVSEDDGGYTFEVELAGVDPRNVEVTADKGVLTVRGGNTAEPGGAKLTWHVVERTRGTFSRAFKLPALANDNAIDASFAHGVLTVRVEKVAEPAPRRIDLKTRS